MHPDWRSRAVAEAAEALGGEIALFRHRYRLDDPDAWHRDPLRPRPWPRRPHALIRLSDPRRPGDVRMQWEAARFHHGLLLARAYLATDETAYVQAFLDQVDAFARGNPPFRSIHWSVGMEVGIRAASWVQTLDLMRGSTPLTRDRCESLIDLLLLHGHFLETHLERHADGFTTNHTVADHAGLAVLGRFFAGSALGDDWRSRATDGLEECLGDQVLAGGAHAEGSLPYERFVLEACLVAARCLPADQARRLREPLIRLAGHLSYATLPSGMPFLGDGDESFFPPFGFAPYAMRNPLDSEPVRQVAAEQLDQPVLRGRPATEEVAFWQGVPAEDRPPSPGPRAPVAHGRGGIRFGAGPFSGWLTQRIEGEGWLPTHGHNDLLSITLDLHNLPLLIDPGTGGYGCDPALRRRLRSTAAHSTVQVEDLEQASIPPRALFEGPAAPPGELAEAAGSVCARFDGFGGGVGHERRVRWEDARIEIEDHLFRVTEEGATGVAVVTTIRYRVAPGLMVKVEEGLALISMGEGTVRIGLREPSATGWRTARAEASRRYGEVEEALVLEARQHGPLPHRWVTTIDLAPRGT